MGAKIRPWISIETHGFDVAPNSGNLHTYIHIYNINGELWHHLSRLIRPFSGLFQPIAGKACFFVSVESFDFDVPLLWDQPWFWWNPSVPMIGSHQQQQDMSNPWENDRKWPIETDDFPIKKTSIYFGDFPWRTVSHNQMVAVFVDPTGNMVIQSLKIMVILAMSWS